MNEVIKNRFHLKAQLLMLGLFYFLFSIGFLFFQQSKSSPAFTASLLHHSGRYAGVASLSGQQLNAGILQAGNAAKSIQYAANGGVSFHKIYHHRQRYDLVSKSVFVPRMLFALLLLFAPVLLTLLAVRSRYNRTSTHLSSFPFFLSITTLRI